MQIRLDPSTPVPPFEQVRAQITLHVAAGRLRPGDRLPTVRTLATQLDVAPNTIARAYRELVSTGIAETAGRRGTFVTSAPPVAHDVASRSELIESAAVAYAESALEAGVSIDEALEVAIVTMRRIFGSST